MTTAATRHIARNAPAATANFRTCQERRGAGSGARSAFFARPLAPWLFLCFWPLPRGSLQPLSNVRGSDVLSEPRTLESGWTRLGWLFLARLLGSLLPGAEGQRP